MIVHIPSDTHTTLTPAFHTVHIGVTYRLVHQTVSKCTVGRHLTHCTSIDSFGGVRLPGYTGFIPESDHNALACYEASAVQQPRQDGKTASMLFTLDQYSRQRVPLYTGHRPTALSNLTVEEPAHGPTRQTTQVLTTIALLHPAYMPPGTGAPLAYGAVCSEQGIEEDFADTQS